MFQIRALFLCDTFWLVVLFTYSAISLSKAEPQYSLQQHDDHYGAYQPHNSNAQFLRYQQQQQPHQQSREDEISEDWNGEDDGEDNEPPLTDSAPQYRPQQPLSPARTPSNYQSPHVYQPRPIVPPPPPADPSVVFVPRLGQIRGNPRYRYAKQRPVQAFLGIKYGVVGNGLARFQPGTVPMYNQNEPIDATREAPRCPQFPDLEEIRGREARGEAVDDCLTLDIYTHTLTTMNPVFVFVHGEMLFDGGAEEGQPDYLLAHDIVLVSVNYRLAPFGFISTLTDEMPGNVALSDLQLALQWVKENIRPFGGNPDDVTLIGQSGGATLIHALSLSGKAQGLFHKLILQSGTALNPFFIDEDPLNTARNIARTARCPVSSGGARENKDLSDCLARLLTGDLLSTFKRHWEVNEQRGLLFTGGFKLSVGDRLGYLPEHPAALVAKSNNSYPMIAGVTKDAGAFIFSRFYDQLTHIRSRNITDYINAVLRYITHPRHYGLWTQLAKREIFTIEDERNPTLENLAQGLLELVNLILYRGPVMDSIRYTLRKQPTFLYCFAYRGQHHRFGNMRNPLPFAIDATLSDDNVYIFPYPEEVSELNRADKILSDQLTEAWVNFVRYNRPIQSEAWPRATTEFGPILRFSEDPVNQKLIMETDQHFGEGIVPPNLYPQYFTTTTTTTTTTPRPYYQTPPPPQQNINSYQPSKPYYQTPPSPYRPDYSRVPAQPYPTPYRPTFQPLRPTPAPRLDQQQHQPWNYQAQY